MLTVTFDCIFSGNGCSKEVVLRYVPLFSMGLYKSFMGNRAVAVALKKSSHKQEGRWEPAKERDKYNQIFKLFNFLLK